MQGPRWCLAGLIVSVVLGYGTSSVAAGSVDLRVRICSWLPCSGGRSTCTRNGPRGWLNGRFLLALWLVVLGFSLYPLLVSGTIGADAIVGWARFGRDLRPRLDGPVRDLTRHDVEFRARCRGGLRHRRGRLVRPERPGRGRPRRAPRGANGPNTTGLLAAIVLVLLALHRPVPRTPRAQAPPCSRSESRPAHVTFVGVKGCGHPRARCVRGAGGTCPA